MAVVLPAGCEEYMPLCTPADEQLALELQRAFDRAKRDDFHATLVKMLLSFSIREDNLRSQLTQSVTSRGGCVRGRKPRVQEWPTRPGRANSVHPLEEGSQGRPRFKPMHGAPYAVSHALGPSQTAFLRRHP
jgi:hypothetical protein